MRIFWDTNILIDLFSDARLNHKMTLQLLNVHIKKSHQIILSPLSLTDTEYILKRHHKLKDFKNRMLRLRAYVKICTVDQSQSDHALKGNWIDFEDELQYQSALEAKCDCIITNDKKGFKQSTIDVYSPIKFLEEHK